MRREVPKNVLKLINIINKEGYEVYLVGGCVRDMIMGKEPHDYDMCTNADPMQLIQIFEKHDLGINPKGLAFGTVTAVMDWEEYEVTTYREDLEYLDSRHPDGVAFTQNIETDLGRRDFTMNAIAYNPITDAMVDPYHGQEDIANGLIRTVRNPDDRFDEDALRILRGLRFAITMGFDIEPETLKAMLKHKDALMYVSKERVTDEFRKMFKANKPIRKWFMECADIIFVLIPELKVCYKFAQNNKYHKHDVYEHMLAVVDGCDTNKFEIKMAALLHDIGKPDSYVTDEEGWGHFYGHPKVSFDICKGLFESDFRLTREEAKLIGDLILYHDIAIAPTEKSIKRAINKYGADYLADWLVLHKADANDHILPEGKVEPDWMKVDEMIAIYEKIMSEKTYFTIKNLVINGNDIKDILNIKGSPIIGELLNYLVDGVIDKKFENTVEDLTKAVKEYALGG